MNNTDFLSTEKNFGSPSKNKYFYLFFIILQSIIVYFLFYEFNMHHQIVLRESPYAKAVSEIKHNIDQLHLITKDTRWPEPTVLMTDKINNFFNNIYHLAETMIAGGVVDNTLFVKIEDPILREKIKIIQYNIIKLEKIFKDSGTLSKQQPEGLAEPFGGKIFKGIYTEVDKCNDYLEKKISLELSKFDFIRNILVLFYIFTFIFLIILFYFFEKKKTKDFYTIMEAQNNAEQKKQWLRVTMRSMGDALLTTDNTANITYINPVASNLTGWRAEDAIGKNIHTIFNIVNEQTRKPVPNPVQEVLKRKYVVGLANHTVLISKDGKEYPIADSGAPIIDNSGNCIGTVLVFHDVTERSEAEKKIKKARTEWERSFNAIKDIITIHDKDMRVTRANYAACSMLKTQEKDLIGRFCFELFSGSDTPCPSCPLFQDDQDLSGREFQIKHKKLGKTYEVSIAPVFDHNYNLEYYVHSMRDISDKIQAEEDLMQARKMEAIGTLSSGIAHDFNNILTVILGYTELAANNKINPEVHDYLKTIETACQRAKSLVNQILTFSRKSNDNQTAPLSPHLIVKESLKLIRASLPSSINLKEKIDNLSGIIVADPTKIQQIIINLCTNAYQAMELERGTIQVSLDRVYLNENDIKADYQVTPGHFIKLSVSDDGHGIDKNTLKRIFDPYFTTKKMGKGTGMGLAMIHGIVKDYKGMIEVQSSPGEGTTFNIYFPATKEKQYKSIRETVDIPKGSEKILIVDDEKAIVGMHKISLEKLGYDVTGFSSSLEALNAFKDNPEKFDLIITDQTMEDMTGKVLSKMVLDIRPDMPIIMNTGFSSMISEEEAKSIGIKGFIMKPIARNELALLVRKILDS